MAISLWCSPLSAFEIPLADVFFGPATPSVIDDIETYPPSHVSFEAGYWDIYHERRPGKLHDYHHDSRRVRGVWQSDRFLFGVRLSRSFLGIEQQNVYTDADRMDGHAEIEQGEFVFGTPRLHPDFRAGLREVQLVGAVGWRDGFSCDVETLIGWGRHASLHLRAETFENDLDLAEEINGYRFPFFFGCRTGRFSGKAENLPLGPLRSRVWGSFEHSVGSGEMRKGFENRPSLRRYTVGSYVEYRLEPRDRFENTPRLVQRDGSFPGIRLTAARNAGSLDLSMYYRGTRYLGIDDLGFTDTTVRLDVVPVWWGSLFGGWQRTRVEHDGDSFFDVWPFNVWDIFVAKRYRLGDTDVELDTWYVGAGVLAESRWWEIDVTGRFEWWHDAGVLNLLERVDQLFPFFFSYERTENDLDISAKYAVQIDPSFLVRPARDVTLRLSGRIAFPFGSEERAAPPGPGPGPSPGEPSSKSVHGGIAGRLELVVGL